MLTRRPSLLAVALLWLLHLLPLPLLAPLGRALGSLLYRFGRRRRRVADINIDLCFPELTSDARRQLVREHLDRKSVV
mgnify:CR=1 FL=1